MVLIITYYRDKILKKWFIGKNNINSIFKLLEIQTKKEGYCKLLIS